MLDAVAISLQCCCDSSYMCYLKYKTDAAAFSYNVVARIIMFLEILNQMLHHNKNIVAVFLTVIFLQVRPCSLKHGGCQIYADASSKLVNML